MTTTLGYNAAGDPTSITNVLGGLTQIGYDSLGRPTAVTDSRGYTTTLVFDDADRVTQIVDALGGTIDLDYLPTGQISTTQIAGLHPITFTYGSNGLPQAVHQGDRTWQYSYDATGNLVGITDPLSRTVRFGYDLATRPISQTLTDGRVVDFGYDSAGNLTSLTPPGRDAHTLTPTPLNLLGVYTPPAVEGATQPISYTYNAAGQVTQIQRPDASTVDLVYDAAGRLETTTIPRGAYELDYDGGTTGVLSGIVAPGGVTLTYAYTGLLPTGQIWQGPVSGSVNVSYDPDLRLASEAVNGQAVSFTYDAAGRLNQAGDLTLTYNPQNGLLAGTSLLNVTDTWQYNGFGEPSAYQATHSGADMLTAAYGRDALGRIVTKTETVNGSTLATGYTYDDAGRLSTVVEDGITVAQYSYDLNGNRLAYTDTLGTVITATYDAQDRLVQYGDRVYEYTAAGELQMKIDTGANLTTTYSYDAFGNLTAVNLPDGTELTYLIDGQNRRIGKLVDGTLSQGFLYKDQLNPVAELDGSGQVVARFIYGRQAHVPDYMVKNGSTYRILTDHLGSPRLVVDAATGQVMQEMVYDAFGNVLTDTNPGFQPFGFAGGLYDQHTKLTRFGARDYDAEVGRWTAKDPLGFEGGDTNLYGYVLADPVNLVDPTGQFFWLALGLGVVGAGVGFATSFLWELASNNFNLSCVNWKNVAVATGVGFVGGFFSPYFAATPIGAAAYAGILNVAQYGATQYVNNKPIQPEGVLISAGTGVIAGAILGPVNTSPRYQPLSGIATSQHRTFARANADFLFMANIGGNAVPRTILSSYLTNVDAKQVVQGVLTWYQTLEQCFQGECVSP